MKLTIETVLWSIFLLDAIANIGFAHSSSFNKWYINKFPRISILFPLSKGWSVLYLIVVIWVGTLIIRLHSRI